VGRCAPGADRADHPTVALASPDARDRIAQHPALLFHMREGLLHPGTLALVTSGDGGEERGQGLGGVLGFRLTLGDRLPHVRQVFFSRDGVRMLCAEPTTLV
jgi:hypothetical protein